MDLPPFPSRTDSDQGLDTPSLLQSLDSRGQLRLLNSGCRSPIKFGSYQLKGLEFDLLNSNLFDSDIMDLL